MIKAYKIRLYPTKEQERKMREHIGACRFIWNYMLAEKERIYHEEHKSLTGYDMMKMLKLLKQNENYSWLNNICNTSLCIVCRYLNNTYTHYYKHEINKPRFKSRKRSKMIFPVRYNTVYFTENQTVNIEKIGKIKFKTDFKFPVGIRMIKTISPCIQFINNKWILSFGIEYENQALQLTDNNMGIDLGIKELAVIAYGTENFVHKLIFNNINKSRKIRNLNLRIKHLQRSISRKYEYNKQGNRYIKTHNIIKQEKIVAKLCYKISCIRNNYIHQCTHQLVSMLPQKVIMETLLVENMCKNRHLSRAIQEQCFYEFIRQMKYKCEWRGITFIQADRFYPSSKTCHQCGCIKKDLTLNDRIYICPDCGYTEDRDFNAALNLMSYKG